MSMEAAQVFSAT